MKALVQMSTVDVGCEHGEIQVEIICENLGTNIRVVLSMDKFVEVLFGEAKVSGDVKHWTVNGKNLISD